MHSRVAYVHTAPGAYNAMLALENYVRNCGIEHSLLHLIKLRASQINGCAYCIDMHWKDARAANASEEHLYMLNAWRESPLYTDRERAALELTEAVTLVSATHVPDEVYGRARDQFSEPELVNLTLAIVTINAWNRLAITFRAEPGKYKPGQIQAA
jgi:AhpD family alkylhydroperoxidase